MERTIEKKQRVEQMYREGIKVSKIAEFFGCSREYVYQILRKLPDFEELSQANRERAKKKSQNYYQSKLDLVKQRLNQGESLSAVAKDLHISYRTLIRELKGTKYDNTKRAKSRRNKKIIKLYQQGLTQNEIANKFGLSQNTVSGILINANVPRRFKNSSKS
jgi:transposase